MARSGAGHPSKAGEQTLLPFRQNRLQGAWACLRELDSLSSSTKRVDPRATTRVHALRRGRTIPIIDTQRPAALCNTVSVTSSRSRAASLRARRDHRNLRIFRHPPSQVPRPQKADPACSSFARLCVSGGQFVSSGLWAKMEPLCLGKPGDPGRSGKDNRLFVEAVLWIVRTGSPWRDLPPSFGNWNSVFTRFRDWVKADVWQRLFDAVSDDPDLEYALVDATIVKVHRHGQGAKGGRKARLLAGPKAA